jgi:hypothetical protein
MDVAIRGSLDGKPTLVVIECKDFDPAKRPDTHKHKKNPSLLIISLQDMLQ